MKRLLIAAALLCGAAPLAAQTIAITGGKVVIGDTVVFGYYHQ